MMRRYSSILISSNNLTGPQSVCGREGSMAKELGKDSMGIQKTMRARDYFSDGIGQLPLNAMSCLIGCLIGVAGCFYRVFTPYSLVSCIIGGSMATFATIPIMCLSGALVNNSVEYNEWKFQHRMVGMSNSASSFGAKIGSGIGGSLIGWILGACGFISGGEASVQPAAVNGGIFAFSIYIPMILLAILAVIFRFYDLERIYPKIVAELKERRGAEDRI